MFLGQYIVKHGGQAYYSPPFGRGGDAATFTVAVTHLAGTPTFDLEVEHKNEADTSWGSLGSFSGITALGIHNASFSGIKEMLRFKGSFSSAPATDGVVVVFYPVVWKQV